MYYELPSSFDSFINLFLTWFLFWILTWYCDNIFPNNRGKTESVLFFLHLDYWKSYLPN